VKINPDEAKTKKFEDVFCNIRFLKLETSDSTLIGGLKNMFVSSEYIFISDFQGVFVFDHSGKLIHKMKKRGRAAEGVPGFYIPIHRYFK